MQLVKVCSLKVIKRLLL